MKKSSIIFIILFLIVAAGSYAFIQKYYPAQPEPQPPPEVLKPNVAVWSPKAGDEVGLPIKIQGEARVFENIVNLRLKDKEGKILVEDIAVAQSPDIGQFGLFEKEIKSLVLQPKDENIILEAYWESPKDGSELDLVSVPLKLVPGGTSIVKAFFNNNELDPEISCSKVFPVERIIPKTQAVGRAALEELLKGPTSPEKEKSFLTSINPGVKIQSLVIENGVAKADFDEQLEFQVGGSCRVSAIRAQITETLKQFPTVKTVVISINGRTEDILQP